MAVDIVMPQMGESIFEGTITKWLKKPGDKVERDEPLFEISTDKVDAEIPSPSAGVLKEIKVGEGQTVPIQTIVGVIDAAGSAAAAPAPVKTAAPPPAPAKAPVAAAPASAPPKPAAPVPPAAPIAAAPASSGSTGERIHSSPLVRRMAVEHGIDLSNVTGTGAGGRISKQDIEAVIPAGGAPATNGIRARGVRRAGTRRTRNGSAARKNVLRQLRSATDERHAAAHRRAHGGVEACFGTCVLGRRNRHDQSGRAARQVQGRIRKALRNQADVHALLREGCGRRTALVSDAERLAGWNERHPAQGDQHRDRRGARLGPARPGSEKRRREKHSRHPAQHERPRGARAFEKAEARGSSGKHILDYQPGRLRRLVRAAGDQPAERLYPRSRRHREAPGSYQ